MAGHQAHQSTGIVDTTEITIGAMSAGGDTTTAGDMAVGAIAISAPRAGDLVKLLRNRSALPVAATLMV